MPMASPDQALQTMIAYLAEKTGKSLPEWVKIARGSGAAKHGEIVKFLKEKHALGHGYANLVAQEAQKADGAAVSQSARSSDNARSAARCAPGRSRSGRRSSRTFGFIRNVLASRARSGYEGALLRFLLESVMRTSSCSSALSGALAMVGLLAVSFEASPAQAGGDAAAAGAKVASANPATTPIARQDAWWQQRHAAMNERVKQGNVDLLFLGDSITEAWEGPGAKLWNERYAPRKAVNLGISGDQTEHLLWRLQNGNLAGIAPKAAVVMIGTNNVGNTGGKHSADQIAAGVKAVLDELAKQTPKTKVLLLAIFPRADPGDAMRTRIAAINEQLAKHAAAEPERITYLDVGPKFLAADATLPADVMPDKLHLSEKGYGIWADAIESELVRLVGSVK